MASKFPTFLKKVPPIPKFYLYRTKFFLMLLLFHLIIYNFHGVEVLITKLPSLSFRPTPL